MTSPASVAGDERLRLFLALRLPEAVLDTIESWQAAQLGGLRLVPRGHLHVTLAFLGHRPAGAPGPPARAAGDGNVCSVRRGCLSVTTASGRGAVRRTGIGWIALNSLWEAESGQARSIGRRP